VNDGGVTDEPRAHRLPVDAAAVIAAIQEQVESLPLPSWPVFALVDSDTPGWLCGFGETLGESQNGTTSVRIDYHPPGEAQRLIVQTQHDQSYWPSLRALLAQLDTDEEDGGEPLELAVEDEGAAASPPAANATVFIDGEPAPAITSHDSDRTVWYARTQDVAVVVAARRVTLKSVRLARIRVLAPFKDERRRIIRAFLAAQPWPPPPYRQ
jgi:hypothetical protein